MSSASVGSHQALTGRTDADARTSERTNDGAGWGWKIPPNFSFARGSREALGSTQSREDGLGSSPCVAKKRSIGGDGA
ncbi:hypothetical protein N7516_011075 [Penicillium verrucosum]|uniref:uncharacterized protein n=1 Tax=Penicillium verrucosum TaxID=60171 RepID=UPI0025457491|nr:uncharacterized protein N7516_011075 [Penicillium verrucosum]KAJ5920217.1 hypothetical protein N7516_011075 [Penicillium verrucosum]